MTTPRTVATYNLNNSVREFDITFDYLSRNFVVVTLLGPTNQLLVAGTDYTFVTPTRIRTVLTYGPPTFTQIEVRRVTSTVDRVVEYQDASILHAIDLNMGDLQSLHVAEEAREVSTNTIAIDANGNLDARNRRIVNLADPVQPQDAVSLAYLINYVAANGGGGGSGPVLWDNIIGKPYASSTIAGIFKVGANLSIDPLTGILSASGTGGGGGAPTGPAGGDLGGTFPNPTLSAAKQAELDGKATTTALTSGLAGKADSAHSHTLSQISQSGATNLQVPQWNTTLGQWVPGTVAGAGRLPVILYLGDSLGSDHPNLAESPAMHLQRTLTAGGYECRVVNLSINGWTYFKANTVAAFGTRTMVQQAGATSQVAAIVTALGFNDTVMAVDGRTLAQVQADAATFFQSLRTAFPTVPIVAGTELTYDKVNFTPAALLNRGTLPALMTLRTTGILTGCWSSEILGDNLSSTLRTRYADFEALDTSVRALTTPTAFITLDFWKIARLGLTSWDGLHLTDEGSRLVGTTWRKAFTTVPALQTLAPNLRALNYGPFDGFMHTNGTVEAGGLWDLLMTPSGSDWATKPFDQTAQHTNHQGGPWTHCNPAAWFLPSKGAYKPSTLAYTTGTTFTWELRNVAPSTDVQSSIDGGAYTTIGQTTHLGDFMGSGILPLTAGTYVFRYKIGNEVHGPVSLVVTTGSSGAGWTPKTISGANLSYSNTVAASTYHRIPYDTANIANSDAGYWNFAAGTGNERRLTLTPPGGSVWVRLSFNVVVSTTGAAVTSTIGFDVFDSAMVLQYRINLGSISDLGYSQALGGTFVGRFSTQTIFVPWVHCPVANTINSAGGGASAPQPIGAYWSAEVINN